ncbi:MAG: hypothetical protein P8J86_10185 [Phycisphaerales bacterium]|nr:hypothetical protein [Phycisphaerales bacterium]
MKLKKRVKLVVAASMLGLSSVALADNIHVSNADMFTDAWAALGSWGHQYHWDDGDESNNPWLSFVESQDPGFIGHSHAVGIQETGWDGFGIESAGLGAGGFSYWADGGESSPDDNEGFWEADGRSQMKTTFTAVEAANFELNVAYQSTLGHTSMGPENSFGYLEDVTTGTIIVDWSAATSGGMGSLTESGMLVAGHEYQLFASALGGSKHGHGHFGESSYELEFVTSYLVPMPAAAMYGLAGLSGLGLSRRRRRRTDA